MSSVATIGSVFKAVCCCHDGCKDVTGVIVSGSPNVMACGPGVTFISAVGKASCGHVCVIISGSSSVYTNGISTARIGDAVNGCPVGVIISGCPTVMSGG